MVFSRVREMSEYDAAVLNHVDEFSYQFFLLGKFLKSYKFKLLDFSHSITMYPVDISIDSEIAEELGVEHDIELDTEEEFISVISKIFNTERVKTVIGSIIQISSSSEMHNKRLWRQ